jgi:hypothetical protein
MRRSFRVHSLQAVEILIQVCMCGATVDFEIVPHLAVDVAIGLTVGQDDLQPLGDEAAFVSNSSGRVGRDWVRNLLMLAEESHALGGFIESR